MVTLYISYIVLQTQFVCTRFLPTACVQRAQKLVTMVEFGKAVFCLTFVILFMVHPYHLSTATASSQNKGESPSKGMYIPIASKSSAAPTYVCHHFRKFCYVPGVSNGWRGWHRKAFSGFVVHKSWMYYMSRVKCPCLFPQAPHPSGNVGSSILEDQLSG